MKRMTRWLPPALLLVAVPLLAPPAAAWGEGTIQAGEVDVHTLFNGGCDLLWFWKLTLTIVDPQEGDSVLLSMQTTDSLPVGADVASWLNPSVTIRGSGNLCLLVAQVTGLTVVGQRTYRLDLEVAGLPDQ
jgi:hypothetical protein